MVGVSCDIDIRVRNDFELLFGIVHFEKYSRHLALYLNMQMTDKSK